MRVSGADCPRGYTSSPHGRRIVARHHGLEHERLRRSGARIRITECVRAVTLERAAFARAPIVAPRHPGGERRCYRRGGADDREVSGLPERSSSPWRSRLGTARSGALRAQVIGELDSTCVVTPGQAPILANLVDRDVLRRHARRRLRVARRSGLCLGRARVERLFRNRTVVRREAIASSRRGGQPRRRRPVIGERRFDVTSPGSLTADG